jgi:hypothetical protein
MTEYYKDQRFKCKDHPYINRGGRELRILAIEQKHIMCRFKGCIPFVKSVKEFPKYLESLEAVEIESIKRK